MVGWSGLTAAQRLPETTVEGAEAPQVGYELPEVVKDRECSTLRETKNKTPVKLNMTHTHQQGEEQRGLAVRDGGEIKTQRKRGRDRIRGNSAFSQWKLMRPLLRNGK